MTRETGDFSCPWLHPGDSPTERGGIAHDTTMWADGLHRTACCLRCQLVNIIFLL